MIHRNRRADDAHFGKYNGLGGKLEAGEDVVTGMRREIREEAGDRMRLAATSRHHQLGRGSASVARTGLASSSSSTSSTARRCWKNPEGALSWVAVEDILQLPLWDGDRFFVPLVFDRSVPQFHGVMPYRADGVPIELGLSGTEWLIIWYEPEALATDNHGKSVANALRLVVAPTHASGKVGSAAPIRTPADSGSPQAFPLAPNG